MANTFNIVISATDKATATVRKVNDSIDRMFRPYKEVGKSFRALGRELHLPAVGKGIAAVGRASAQTAKKLVSVATPLAAITSIATIAGMTALVDRWANFGRATTNAAKGIGITTSELQRMQGVGALAGISSDGVASSLQNLGTTMEDARWGRNPAALMLLNRVGIGLKRTKTGAWDVVGAMHDLARVMASPQMRNNPYAQSLLANQLGVSEMLPILRQGEAGLQQYAAIQKRLGYVSSEADIRNANEFALSIAGLKMSVEGLGQSIMDKAMPALQPFVDGLAGWVSNNRELVSQDVAGVVKTVAEYVKSINWKEVGNSVSSFLQDTKDGLGSIKEIADDVAGAFRYIREASGHFKTGLNNLSAKNVGGALGQGVTNYATVLDSAERKYIPGYAWLADKLTAPKGNDNSATVDDGLRNRSIAYFQSKGWTKEQAAGISANLATESSLNPHAIGDSGNAYGIGQWHPDRQEAFARWAGHDIRGSSLQEQLDFTQFELTKGSEQAAGNALRNAQTAADAGAIVSSKYERPADTDGEARRRAALAESYMANPATGPYGPTSGVAAQPAATGPGAVGNVDAGTKKIHVEVSIPNAPQGTQAKVRTGDDVTASVRIGYPGVGAMA